MKTRTENAKLNIIIGIITQIFTLILSFVGRKLFLMYLSVDYLGINGLYTNLLSVLSLAELGLGSIVSFSLYKPVRDNNQDQICALVSYFKKLYMTIALVISVAGLSMVPFLKYIITSDLPEQDLILYYLLFLISSVATYFVAHDVSLLSAYQENRTQKIVTLMGTIVTQLLHIVILVFVPNYMLYVAATVVTAIVSNVVFAYIAHRRHLFIKDIKNYSKEDLRRTGINTKQLLIKMKSGILYKFSCIVLNSTDNILISVLVSTAAVGMCSNYLTITSALQAFIAIVTTAIISAVGNLNAENNTERMLEIFNMLTFLYHVMSCFCGLTLFYVFNPFISVWLGETYTMSKAIVFAIAFNFFVTNMTTTIWSFREATGQFEKAKYIMCTAALLNIFFSIILGKVCGVFGILIATAISKILTMFWYEPIILFKNVFKETILVYWKHQLKYLICGLLSIVISALGVSKITIEGIGFVFIAGMISAITCFGVYGILNYRSKEMKTLFEFIDMKKNIS